MGGLCSKFAKSDKVFAKTDGHDHNNHDKSGCKNCKATMVSDFQTAPHVRERIENKKQEPAAKNEGNGPYDFYDGIPRFNDSFSQKSGSVKSRQAAVAKVSDKFIEKAVDVLDTLGSSMTNLNTGSGFVSGAAMKGNEITIVSFEVANTIVKGFGLMESLSTRSIRHLKEEVTSNSCL